MSESVSPPSRDAFFDAYTPAFYRQHLDENHTAAYRRMAYVIGDELAPERVIDVGCGLGNLLSELKNTRGVERVRGFEARGAYDAIQKAGVVKDVAGYIEYIDLRNPPVLPDDMSVWKGDLAISVEVAEHLPEEAAPGYLKFLCSLSDTIVFSAAYPGQGGTGHINERSFDWWHAEFAKQGFRWDEDISRRIQAKLRGHVGTCFWYERLHVFRRA